MRRLAGEHILDEEVIRSNQNLMPELGGLLRGLAQDRVADDGDSCDDDSSAVFDDEAVPGWSQGEDSDELAEPAGWDEPPVLPGSFRPPRELGDVRLGTELGRGGMGVIFLGYSHGMSCEVAVKFVCKEGLSLNARECEELLRGARLAAQVEHRNLTPIYHADRVECVPYLIMKYIDGPVLRGILNDGGPLDEPTALELMSSVSEAVAALHNQGITHGDIKPSNVLLDSDGRIFVSDYGLTFNQLRTGGVTRVFGTPPYMAPEAFDGVMTARGDVYALGIMTYELLAGSLPFVGTADEIRRLQSSGPVAFEPLRQGNVSSGLIEAMERALQADPTNRFTTAREFHSALTDTMSH